MSLNKLKNTSFHHLESDDEVEIEFPDDNPSEDGTDEEPLMEEPFNPNEINIVSKQDSLRNLINRLEHDEIDMNTDFQREAELWTNKQMSRLIESILIRIPLPAFYFDATDDEKWLVVDGLQRLSSIKKFVIDKKLQLNGLEYLDLKGATYNELPRTYQRRIDECSVTLFLIQPGTPDEVKYSIFRRINTGGLTLNFQEIRNALATPRIRRYLQWLSNKKYLKKTIGANTKRMQGQELALRFLAFYLMDYLETKKNITVFLDEMMAKLEEMDKEELNRLETTYRMALKRSWDIFGETAFEKITENGDPVKRQRKNSTLFEVWTVALARLSEEEINTLVAKKEILKKKHIQLTTHDEIYFRSITFSTQTKNSYRIRCEKVQGLINEVLNA
ncbi:MAG: DUF262 domain-containing protein [Candidatus Electrothrix sp. AUS4]|nr:DUF262 domain-containing protein [Candidatus Electrothrix sp. AUS4]